MEIITSAFRQLRAQPLFSALIILLLALGIGANTAIFGVVHAVLLKPLPYPGAGELVMVRKPPREGASSISGGGDRVPDTEFVGWTEAQPKSFRTLAAYRNSTSSLQLGDGAVRVPAAAVTGEFFSMLGVTAWRGRLFDAADLKPGAALTTVLSYTAWQSRYQGSEDVLGQIAQIDDVAHTIIGVMPPAFEFVDPVQFWRPLQVSASKPGELRIQLVTVFGRLFPGTSLEGAQRELDGISERFWGNLMSSAFSRLGPESGGQPGMQRIEAGGPSPKSGGQSHGKQVVADGHGPQSGSPGEERVVASAPSGEPTSTTVSGLRPGMSLQLPPGANPNDPAIQRAIASAMAQRKAGGGGSIAFAGPKEPSESAGAVEKRQPSSSGERQVLAGPREQPSETGTASTPGREPPPTTSGSIADRLASRGFRIPFADAKALLIPLQEQLAKQSRATLWLLLGAVGFVLLIACANIANLQLARAAGRKRDTAIRAALGASPTRLALELLTENLLLATLGGAVGVLLAWWGTQALQIWLTDFLPRVTPVEVSFPVLGFALLIALIAGLGFGLAPAWQGSRVDLTETLKEGSHQNSSLSNRWRQTLVALEVALALVLAINTGLLVKSIYKLYTTELGYRTSNVLTANLSLPRRYSSQVQQRAFADRWLESLRALPGVKIASLTDLPPLSAYSQIVIAVGQGSTGNTDASTGSAPPTMAVANASPDFFRAAGIALRQGRYFTEQDLPGAPMVAIVNETYVKTFYPKGFTLGAKIELPEAGHAGGGGTPEIGAIVGVIADVRPRGFESEAQPLAYFSLAQKPRSRISAVLHFEGDSATLARAVTMATHKIDAGLALDSPQTLEQQINRQTASRRVTLALTGAFATTAVLLAALGIFGVMSYTVTQRTQEIGVRMALGADSGTILRWIMRYGGIAIGAGLAVGLVLTFATGRLLTTFLVGITALDPAVIVVGVVGLAAVGLLACFLPALRATRVNPVDALRNE